MQVLLISPPVGNVGQAAAGISVLTAFLKSRGWDARQWDLSIEAFHHFHSFHYLDGCRKVVQARGADDELLALAERVVNGIEDTKQRLRRPDITSDPEGMRRGFEVVRESGTLMTAASLGRYQHDFRSFHLPGALSDLDSLAARLADRQSNPFIEFFESQALPRLVRDAPAAVGISVTYFSQLVAAFTLTRLIRDHLPQTRLVLGGSYLTATREDVERLAPAVLPADAIILHDGEEALDLWLHAVLRGRGKPSEAPNILLPGDGVFAKQGEQPVHQTEFAVLPVPMWTMDGLELDRYLVPKYAVGLPLTRGCHWGRCVYCNISSQSSGHYRRRDSNQAVADMRAIIAETGSNWFDFPVDSYRPQDLLELSRALLAAELKVEWAAEVLLDSGFTAGIIAELARSGCRCLRFGLESGCPATLKSMHKPTRPQTAARILAACRQHGIRTGVMVIAGYPTETQAELQQTFDFLVDHRSCIDFIGIHPYSLVPGSPMARDPGKFGLYLRSGAGLLTSSLPFTNTNPVGMRNEDLPRVIDAMRAGLREHYPDLGELWTAAIGGWMTFAACCEGNQRR